MHLILTHGCCFSCEFFFPCLFCDWTERGLGNSAHLFVSNPLLAVSRMCGKRHAGSYGVDLTMCVGTAMFFNDHFHQSIAASGAIAFSYGISAVFARGLGGYISDLAYGCFSLRGRLCAQMISMVVQGLLCLLFASRTTLFESIVVMVVFSIFVQVSDVVNI